MSIRSAQTVVVEFTTARFDTGAATTADSLPTGTLVLNGVDNAAAVTVTLVDTGRYKASVTMPTLAVGDIVELSVAATVNSVAGKAIVWRDTKDVVIDSAGLVDANAVKVGPTGSGTAQTARDLGLALPAAAPNTNGGLPILSVSGTTLAYTVSTITTYTGDTPQTGDSFARLTGTGAVTFASLTVTGTMSVAGAGGFNVASGIAANITGNLSGSVGSVTGLTASDVGSIKAKTDHLPSSDIVHTAGKLWVLDGSGNAVAPASDSSAIKTKTDALPGDPADASDIAASFATLAAAVAAVQADLPQRITKNTALAGFTFPLFDSTDHATPKTGRTVTATRSIDGGAFSACTNAVTEISNGAYTIDLSAADLNGNVVLLRFTATGADDQLITLITEPT